MGEAIALFREMALAVRRHSDQRFSEPRAAVSEAAANRLSSRCLRAIRDFEAGRIDADRYVRDLRGAKRIAELSIERDHIGQTQFASVEWLPAAMKARPPSSIKPFAEAAAKEALKWDSRFEIIEPRIRALAKATADMLAYSGMDYSGRVTRWQQAFDALAPFIEEPPLAAANSERKTGGSKQKKRRDRKGVGGRPAKYPMKFIREVVAARERDQKHARTLRRPLPPIPRWLRDHCIENDIDIGEMFPQSVPGEAWSDRANRFWRAATKRLREAETNRH